MVGWKSFWKHTLELYCLVNYYISDSYTSYKTGTVLQTHFKNELKHGTYRITFIINTLQKKVGFQLTLFIRNYSFTDTESTSYNGWTIIFFLSSVNKSSFVC